MKAWAALWSQVLHGVHTVPPWEHSLDHSLFVQSELFFFSLFLSLFILRESECVLCGGWVAEREGERVPSRPHTVTAELDVGLELMNCEIMT